MCLKYIHILYSYSRADLCDSTPGICVPSARCSAESRRSSCSREASAWPKKGANCAVEAKVGGMTIRAWNRDLALGATYF